MTDQELDALLGRLLLDAVRLETEQVSEPTRPFEPSRRYRREIREMLADPTGWAGRRGRPRWKKGLYRAAMAAAVCLVLCGSFAFFRSNVQAGIHRWTTEVYDDHILYLYDGDSIDGPMPQYEVTVLPYGYAENTGKRTEWENYVGLTYETEENDEPIYFRYMYMQRGSSTNFAVDDDTEVTSVTVNGLEGTLFVVPDTQYVYIKVPWIDPNEALRFARKTQATFNAISWIDPDENIHFTIEADLNEDELMRLAESVSLTTG